jgi:DNA helicase-2/ATP-dependent DNA helicase PcrA
MATGEEHLQESYQLLREEVLESVARIGGHLGELRLDTELDISHGIVRYLELVKLAALLQRPAGQDLEEALADVNARLLAATTPVQREIFQTSPLDEALIARSDVSGREEHSLGPFLPRKGVGLALSASDIETYRSCPLRYKFARVLRIPTEQTPHQRFGIVVHQVLERFHCEGAQTLAQMHELLDAGWRRAGFGDSEYERELLGKARRALERYHERLGEHDAEPVWFERSFSFRLGPHHLRGRVDRVDRIRAAEGGEDGAGADGAEEQYELIDYKTSRPKSAEQLENDVQLSLYALAAREDWGLRSSRQAYYYVLDDLKVPVGRGAQDEASLEQLVMAVGEGILAQEFEPTPSQAACSICDYRIVCPVAEK